MSIRSVPELDAAADTLLGQERLGHQKPLPASWAPGDSCPSTETACESLRCFAEGHCLLRPTLTSKLVAEAGRYLARWAREAGAQAMCRGCAFREGTRANRTDGTIIDIVECLRTGAPFMCHDGLTHGEAPKVECAGWKALATPDPRPEER